MEYLSLVAFVAFVLWGAWYAIKQFQQNGGVQANSKSTIRRSLSATVIRACPTCNAPGVDENNKYVGETCPKCGGARPPIEDKGEVWFKNL